MTYPTRLVHTDAACYGIPAATIDACTRFCPVTWSDLHKDAYGTRPLFSLEGKSAADLDALWISTMRAAQESIDEDARRETAAVATFDALVDETIALGAADYATAVRWLMDGDLDFCLWEHGITTFQNTRRIRELAGL